MKEWYKGIELVGFDGMPNSNHAIANKAKRNKWLRRKASGQGSALEYHISYFHEDIQKALYEKYATLLDHEDYGEYFSNDVAELFKQSALDYMYSNELLPVSYEEKETLPEPNVSSINVVNPTYADTIDIPEFNVQAAAGAGCLTNAEYQTGTFTVSAELIKSLGLLPQYTAIVFCSGESMLPTMNDGDRILVDTRELTEPVKDGVYVIRIDEMVYVKRLKWNILEQSYSVISDNHDHDSFDIIGENLKRLEINGRASMVMRAL